LALKIGTKLKLGEDVELEITQFGKKCHSRCEIFEQVGDCIMPREGIFARVISPGRLRVGDSIEVADD
jgi:MOSC domain-containing protein YiiM